MLQVKLYTVLMIITVNLKSCSTASDTYCSKFWSNIKATIKDGTQPEFQKTISAFTQATKNTYTWRLNETVPEWKLIHTVKPECGLHALAYQV